MVVAMQQEQQVQAHLHGGKADVSTCVADIAGSPGQQRGAFVPWVKGARLWALQRLLQLAGESGRVEGMFN